VANETKSVEDLVLLVEDDPYDAKLIVRAVEKARFLNPIETVADGEAAVAYLSGQPPYDDRARYPLPVLILLDLKLPKLDGFEVLRWIRGLPLLRRIPVVVLTSSSLSADVGRAYDLGANSYLVKPVGTNELIDLLKTIELYWLVTNAKPSLEAE
jgi:CheY-like chemotaxis protein